MKLGIAERLVLFNALPREGSFENLRLARELRETLTLTEAEHTETHFRLETPDPEKPNEKRWVWDTNPLKEFTFTDGAKRLLRSGLETVSTKGEAQELHLLLYEQLGPNGKPPEAGGGDARPK